MDLHELERKLIAAARAQVPSDAVPPAFEARVMARLRELHEPDFVTVWAQGLWRGALASLAATAVVGLALALVTQLATDGESVAERFETAMLAGIELEGDQ
ncbi:MAG: hypothetical protein RMH97_00930 [Verrucomicrobiales bacterium]|nr:hypothetical protein [Verrucomicrobiales bacterium]